MPPQSDHYRFEQVGESAWAAVAADAGAAVGNAGIAGLGNGSLVVDCGYTPAAARDLRAAAEELAGPVERLVVTHADFDHYGGAQVFADVPIVASERTRAAIVENGPDRISELRETMDAYLAELEERDAPDWECRQGRAIAVEVPTLELTPPTETFAGELPVGEALVIECGTAHTASDAVVWLPARRVLFAADLIGVGSHLNLTRGDPNNWLAILGRLATLEPDLVVPGHGPPAGPEAIATAREYIQTVLALAAEPGEHELPAAYEGWQFAEGFQQNIDALRAKQAA
jgi:glyoxylase-like metal-dependent hydrolase (beta-lactamase superfamily II)